MIGLSDGSSVEILRGGTRRMLQSDPVLSIAHFRIAPDSATKMQEGGGGGLHASSESATYTYVRKLVVDGQPKELNIRVDGRKHSFEVNGQQFDLTKGNFFEIVVGPAAKVAVEQLPIVDMLEDDPKKVAERMANFKREQMNSLAPTEPST